MLMVTLLSSLQTFDFVISCTFIVCADCFVVLIGQFDVIHIFSIEDKVNVQSFLEV